MAFRNIRVALTASSGNLRSQLALAAREVDRFGKSVETTNKKAVSTSQMMKAGVVGAAIGVGVALGGAVIAAAGFEQRMRNVNSISSLSESRLKALSNEVVNLSRGLPQSANNLAEGLYDIASSGFQGAEGIKVLNSAAEAASAGLSTTATSAKGITAVLNAYGLGAEHSTDVSDALFQTVNLGVVSFDELASNIGDVVGAAAAAKIPIGDVGAAIAAMTLSGISAAESTTSLNRVIQSIIQPSDSLASALKSLGYESGAQALEADGLRGVMEKLRLATGGNITSLLQLFPEIRAARGALALMAAEGENYRKTSEGISDAEARQGATRKALKEQMKAVSAQFQIFKNQANAAAIMAGSKLLPAVLGLLTGVQSLARRGWPVMQAGMRALMPFFRNIRDIGIDVVEVLRTLVETASPVVKVAAALIGIGLATFLNTVSTLVEQLTGFLADNKGAVVGVATVLTALLIPALLRSAAAFGALVLDKIAMGLYGVAGGADKAASGIRSLGLVGTGGLVALGVVAGAVTAAFGNANKRAEELVDTVTDGMDATTFRGLTDALDELNALRDAQLATGDSSSSMGNSFKGVVQVLTPMENKVLDAQKAVDALNSSIASVDVQAGNQWRNVSNALVKLKIPDGTYESWTKLRPQVEAMAKKLGVDLSQGGKEGERAVDKVVDALVVMQKQTGVTSETLQRNGVVDLEAMEKLASAVADVTKKTQDAFSASNDLFGSFDADLFDTGKASVKDARDELASAQRELADVESQRSADKTTSVADEQRLRDARDKVAEATRKVGDAERGVVTGGQQIRQFYTERIEDSKKFASNLQKAVAQGLDPTFIQRALEAGPEKAGPILEAIVSDHSGRMARMVNESEATLREISVRMATFARLTTLAVNATTDEMVDDLDTAMKIAAQDLASGGKQTAEAVAKAIGVPTEEVRRVAKNYGIILGGDINAGLVEFIRGTTANAVAGIVKGSITAAATAVAPTTAQILSSVAPLTQPTATNIPTGRSIFDTRRATGGIDAHFATSPSVLYGERSTGGEAFIPLGRQHRNRSRSIWERTGRILGMAQGGLINGSMVRHQSAGNTVTHITKKSVIAIGDVYAQDLEATLLQADRRRRQASLTGDDD